MAALDTPTYEQLLERARQLEPTDQLRLLEGLASLVRQEIDTVPSHTITELRGLGKATWQGIDAQGYVDRERDTWNGLRIRKAT